MAEASDPRRVHSERNEPRAQPSLGLRIQCRPSRSAESTGAVCAPPNVDGDRGHLAVAPFLDLASMEPSTNVDGDQGERCDTRHCRAASMEPSTNVDGDVRAQTHAAVSPSAASMEPSTNVDGDRSRADRTPVVIAASMEPSTNVDGDRACGAIARIVRRASMEPSTNVDGDGELRRCRTVARCRFNGAVDERRRRRSGSTRRRAARVASMEPSTNVDGDRRDAGGAAARARFNGAVDERRRRPARRRDGARVALLQWSRRRTSTETMRGAESRRAIAVLQWSRRRTSTETARSRSASTLGIVVLQWSRRRTSTETGRRRRRRASVLGASMEPSTNVDGDAPSAASARRSHRRFNGAVDERRRRPASSTTRRAPPCTLQWSRRRTSTETAARDVAPRERRRASMEPSTNVDGDQRDAGHAVASSTRFNGAVDERRRRRRRRAARRGGRPRFNGAVDERRRRRRRPRPMPSPTWRFNGAVDERRRRQPCADGGRRCDVASMEPSTNVDGDAIALEPGSGTVARLQWSRRRTSTET